MTPEMLIQYVLCHPKRETVLPGWTDEQLTLKLYQTMASGLFISAMTAEGKIMGAVFGEFDEFRIHIWAYFIEHKSMLRIFSQYRRDKYSAFTFSGNRHNRRCLFFPRSKQASAGARARRATSGGAAARRSDEVAESP